MSARRLKAKRRKREEAKYDGWAEENASEEKWRIENGHKTEAKEYAQYFEDLKAAGYEEAPPWEQAEALMLATDHKRLRHLPPTAEEVETKRRTILQFLESAGEPSVHFTLQPFEPTRHFGPVTV